MSIIAKLILGIAILSLLSNSIAINQVKEQHSTIIENNHFYSNYEINTTYQITKVDVSRPIIMLLRKKETNSVFDNKIYITLVSGEKSSECLFSSFDKMCFLNNLPTSDMSLKIKCDHLPCEASWTILQPPMKKVQEQQQVSDLFDISESNNHMIAVVTCNNPEIKEFNKKIHAYSENDFILGYTDDIIYYLFSKQKDGHLYFTIQQDAKSCAQMGTYNVKQTINGGETLKDFILSDKYSQFKFSNRPTKQFRLDISMHELEREAIATSLQIKILGQKNGVEQQIKNASIKPGFGTTVYDYCFVVPAIHEQFSNLRIQFKSNNKILMLNFQLYQGKAVIHEAQHAHFVMKSGQKLNFQIAPNENAGADQIVKVFLASSKKVKSSKQECSRKNGCDFQLTAHENVESLLYIGTTDKSESTKNQIIFLEFTDKITHKIHENDFVYLKKEIKKDKNFQILVNNPNVVLHAASQEKCQKPSSQCYQKIGNMHNPFVYGPVKDGNLLIAVQGLQNCEFTLTSLSDGEGAIDLCNNQPFVYLMDDHQSSLIFKFNNPEKEGVSFNLIAPLNNLLLIVKQGKQNPDPDQDTNSLDGFLSYKQKQISDKQFRIMVKKAQNVKDKFIHFTLIATINGANIRMDPGIPYYETMKKKEHRDFVFQFDKPEDYLVNFYTHNIAAKQTLKILLLVSNQDEWTSKTVKHFQISQISDSLNLKDVSQELCHQAGQVSCEIFIRLVNSMNVEIDMTITLIVKDSIIELKDGLWQSYSLNQVAQTSHFFFLPKNFHKSINVVYRSSFVDFGVVYSIWKSDEKTINPAQWPFPAYQEEVDNKMDEFKSINHIVIDHTSLKQCWPSCIVLVSLYKKKNGIPLKKGEYVGSYSIMASNQVFELPEKTKLDIFLKKDEAKYIMVDLKYALEKQALTFFRTSVLGYEMLSANVYSQKNQRCPEDFDGDFSFGSVETVIKIESIKKKISQNDMDDDQNLYLCIHAKAYMQSKFNLEYTTEDEIIKVLRFDTFQTVTLVPKTPKMFQLEAWQSYEVKFIRQKGYFFVKLSVCNGVKDGGYQQCLQDLQNGDDKGKKVVSKTEQFSEQPCPKCIVYIRLQSDEQCQIIIHIQSKFSTIQLKENSLISDFTNEGEQNKYTITSVQAEQTIINIEISQGNPVVTITDYGKLNVQRQKNSSTNNIHIVIPPIQDSEGKKSLTPAFGGASYYAFGYSKTFRFLAVKIKSKDPKMPCAYTISYSSGESQTYLEDGLLTGYTLQANKLSKFLYKNSNPKSLNRGYITVSMNKSATLYNLELKMYTMNDPYDEESKKQVTPTKPPMRKKTPNPTMTFSLPISPMVSLELQSAEQAKVTIMVNHQEVIIVPFDQQFPFQLMKNQKISLLTDVNNVGYILVSLRKCDQSEPTFGYSFNYQNFQKSEFEYSTSLQDDPKFQFYIKASKIGTLYMQLINNDVAHGLFAITLKYSDAKIATGKIKSGNNGLVDYQILNSKTALIKFNGAVCPKGKCSQNVKYYWAAGKTLQNVYTQLVCPYSYFLMLDVISVPPLTFTQIKNTNSKNTDITFEYPLIDHVSYLSIKGVSGDEEIYYRPLQIITLWGTINKSTWFHKMGVTFIIVILFCSLLIIYRRLCGKKEYDKLSDNPYDYA